MYSTGADDLSVLARFHFQAETDAAARQTRSAYRRLASDYAEGRITFAEMRHLSDVASAHATARVIRAVTELARSYGAAPAL